MMKTEWSHVWRRHWIAVFCMFLLGVVPSSLRAAGVRATPQFIFHDAGDKSSKVNISNPSDQDVEVWIDIKYGYHMSDDTGKLINLTPDTLLADDRSAAGWLSVYPVRFTLGPRGSQVVRIVTSPPPGVIAGEYWSRIIVSSKNLQRPKVKGKTGFTSSMEIITSTSLPYHYRHVAANTGLQLLRPIETNIETNSVRLLLPMRRTGNASFWGVVSSRFVNSAGRVVYTQENKLVVYKDYIFAIRYDKAKLPPGSYTIELTVKAERGDINRSHLLPIEPVSWNVPINIF